MSNESLLRYFARKQMDAKTKEALDKCELTFENAIDELDAAGLTYNEIVEYFGDLKIIELW